MAAHIFISYSTRNSDYAYRLAEQLQARGFDVWIDNAQLRSGSNWWESIVLALRDCAAFIVIMSPEARQSKWVQREVTLADNWNKPTFPLLLDGQNWEIFVLTQFRDVSDGSLPPEKFYEDLAAHAPRRSEGGTNVTTSATLPDDDDDITTIEEIRNPPPPDDDAQEAVNLPARTPGGNRPRRRYGLLAGAVVILAILAVVLTSLPNNRGPSDLEMTPSTEVPTEGIIRFSQQTATAAAFFAQTETAQAGVTRMTPTAARTQEPTSPAATSTARYPAPLEDYTVLRRYDPAGNYLAWALQADLGEPILYTGSQGGVVLEVGNCQNCGEEGASIIDRGFELGAAQILNDPGWNFGYGHFVRIRFDFDHLPDSTRQTLEMNDLGGVDVVCTYSHLQKIHVQQNEILASAQVIATVGESGNASGPFLRLECHAADDIENMSLAAARSHAVDPAILFNL